MYFLLDIQHKQNNLYNCIAIERKNLMLSCEMLESTFVITEDKLMKTFKIPQTNPKLNPPPAKVAASLTAELTCMEC